LIKKKLVILSGKGGVGKSSVAVNLASALADEGYKVGILDVDLHGPNVPRMLGIVDQSLRADENEMIIPATVMENLKVVSIAFLIEEGKPLIWRGPLKHKLINDFVNKVNWGDLDFLVIDSPPGTGDELLSTFQLFKDIDGAILVTTPQQVSIDDVERAKGFVDAFKSKILGIVLNMVYLVCPKCGERIELFPRRIENLDLDILVELPMDPNFALMMDEGKPAVWYMRGSELESKFRDLAGKVIEGL